MRRALFERIAGYEGGRFADVTYKPHLPLLAQSSLQFPHSCAAMEVQQKGNLNVVPAATCKFFFLLLASFDMPVHFFCSCSCFFTGCTRSLMHKIKADHLLRLSAVPIVESCLLTQSFALFEGLGMAVE